MNNVLIVLNGQTNLNIKALIKEKKINRVIAVDGGYNICQKQQVQVDLIVGDLDSIESELINPTLEVKKYNPKKDYTDFQLALNEVKDEEKIYVCAYVSDTRLEHFYANLQLIEERIEFIDQKQLIKLLRPGEYSFSLKWEFLSLFAINEVENLTLKNVDYPLENYRLKEKDIIGISNILKENNKITFTKGKLLVFLSCE